MTECDEIAAALFPGYMAQRACAWSRQQAAISAQKYVDLYMPDGTYQVRSNVTWALQQLEKAHDNPA